VEAFVKILIAADMEGITGVTNWDQVTPGHFEYPRFRHLMTGDVNAAIQGAFEAGADQVVVTDGHSGGANLLIEELDSRAHLNAGNESPFAMVQGIQDGADGVCFIGYHARAGSLNAILDHTWSSKKVANLWLNDLLLGEAGLNAALCGHYNAPVLMISGDQTACAQAMDLLGSVETAAVKRATGRMSAECLPPDRAHDLICEAVGRAVLRLKQGKAPKPFRLSEPVHGVIEFFSSDMADRAVRLPEAQRLDGRRVELVTPDMPTAYIGFRALVALG
jgi:D-amino peptidase